jgi:outer membrane protein
MKRAMLKQMFVVVCLLLTAAAAHAQTAGARVAIISMQEAVARTQEGQKLANDLQAKYKPTQDAMQKQVGEINTLRDQLQRGANTMSDDAKRDLIRDIQNKEKQLQRGREDAQADFNGELQAYQQQMLGKIMPVLDKFAKEKGYAVVLDISSPESPVLYAVNEANITNDVIQLYDHEHPVAAASPGAGAAAPSPAAKPRP